MSSRGETSESAVKTSELPSTSAVTPTVFVSAMSLMKSESALMSKSALEVVTSVFPFESETETPSFSALSFQPVISLVESLGSEWTASIFTVKILGTLLSSRTLNCNL